MKRRRFLLASSSLAGSIIVPHARAATPCPPPLVSTATGSVSSTSCGAATGSSALSRLASTMAVGSWAELTTSGINAALLSGSNAGGVGGNNIPYSNQMAWNPITKQIKFACSDHGAAYMPELTYDEAANAWSVQQASGFGAAGTHAYGHFCVRPDTGDLYSRHNGGGNASENVYRRLSGSGSWAKYSPSSPTVYTQIGVCAVWWPGSNTGHTALQGFGAAGCYIVFEISLGSIVAYDPISASWATISTPSIYPAADPYHTVAAYSRQFNCVVYGGGNGNRRMFRLNPDRTVTELAACPVSIGVQGANLQVDPVSGKFIIWGGGSNARKLYEFDPRGSGTYTLLSASRQPPAAGPRGVSDPSGGPGGPDALVSCPLPAHGVIAYMSASGASYANVFLYKHA
jgi:hypothetical protein